MRAHERHVVKRRAALREAGGGLDILRAARRDDLAELDLFLVREQAALDDDLEELSAARSLDADDLVKQHVPALVLHHAEIDDHIDLVRAVFHGVLGLKDLGGGGVVAVRKADDGADLHLSVYIPLGSRHMRGRDTHGGAAEADRVIAQSADLRGGAVGAEERMIAAGKNVFYIHDVLPFLLIDVCIISHARQRNKAFCPRRVNRLWRGVTNG